MKTLLVVDSSGRRTRSITRSITEHAAKAWQALSPEHQVVHREVGLTPPSPVNEAWIAGAFSEPNALTPEHRQALQLSDELIEELAGADAVVIAAPIYNFGMPAQLKAYFDQVIRPGRTFAYVPESENPYQPLLESRPVLVVISAADASMHPGGALYPVNFLEPHVQAVLGFIGLKEITLIRIGGEEFKAERQQGPGTTAESAAEAWVLAAANAPTAEPVLEPS